MCFTGIKVRLKKLLEITCGRIRRPHTRTFHLKDVSRNYAGEEPEHCPAKHTTIRRSLRTREETSLSGTWTHNKRVGERLLGMPLRKRANRLNHVGSSIHKLLRQLHTDEAKPWNLANDGDLVSLSRILAKVRVNDLPIYTTAGSSPYNDCSNTANYKTSG